MRLLSPPEQALKQGLLLLYFDGETLPNVKLVEANILCRREVPNKIEHELLRELATQQHVRLVAPQDCLDGRG